MASFSSLTSGNGTSNSAFNSSSHSPTTGRLVIAFFCGGYTGASTTPSLGGTPISGNSLTWNAIGSTRFPQGAAKGGARRWVIVAAYYAIATAPTSGATTFNFGASVDYADWSIFETSDYDPSNPIRNIVLTADSSTTPGNSLTEGSFFGTGDGTVAGWATTTGSTGAAVTQSAGSGMTAMDNLSSGRLMTEYAAGNISSPATSGPSNAGGIAFEVVNSGVLSSVTTALTASTSGQSVTVTSPRGAWTSGTPGSPAFYMDSSEGSTGVITAQTVNSATSVTLTITTGAAGIVRIVDPLMGTTLVIPVTGTAASPIYEYPTATVSNQLTSNDVLGQNASAWSSINKGQTSSAAFYIGLLEGGSPATDDQYVEVNVGPTTLVGAATISQIDAYMIAEIVDANQSGHTLICHADIKTAGQNSGAYLGDVTGSTQTGAGTITSSAMSFTGLAWSQADLNAAVIKFRIVTHTVSNSCHFRIRAVWVKATFASSGPSHGVIASVIAHMLAALSFGTPDSP